MSADCIWDFKVKWKRNSTYWISDTSPNGTFLEANATSIVENDNYIITCGVSKLKYSQIAWKHSSIILQGISCLGSHFEIAFLS